MSLKELTDEQWWCIADYASYPVELTKEANDNNEEYYVYDRYFGYFAVRCGHHQIVMAQLWAFRNNNENVFADPKEDLHSAADKWLQLTGTCFHSSCAGKPHVWKKSNLNSYEKLILGPDFLEIED